MDEQELQMVELAKQFVKDQKKEIIAKFAGEQIPSVEKPISIFMAGSPGAGKTEVSKRLIEDLSRETTDRFARIDPDEVREMLPGYTGSNSALFQGPVIKAVEIVHDYVLAKHKHFVLDGTFSHHDVARKNIDRSLRHGRSIVVVYVHQEPSRAWEFILAREMQNGRSVPRDEFVRQYFTAQQTVNQMKREFGDRVVIRYVENAEQQKYYMNIQSVDEYLPRRYSEDELRKIVYDQIT